MTYAFQHTLYITSADAHAAMAAEWLTAGGWNSHTDVLRALRTHTDAELADEATAGWALNELEYFDVGKLRAAFAALRAHKMQEDQP